MSSQSFHRRKDYLVIASIGNVNRRIVWNDSKPLPLDFPEGWTLAKLGSKICIFDKSLPTVELMEKHALFSQDLTEHQRMVIDLPPALGGNPDRTLGVTLIPLQPLNPPYLQTSPEVYNNPSIVKQLMLFQGVRYFLLKYRPVGQRLTTSTPMGPVFTYERAAHGYLLTAHQPGLVCKTKGKRQPLPQGMSRTFSEEEFFTSVFVYGIHWWRFRSVQSPDSMAPIEREDSEEDYREQQRFENSSKLVVSLLLSAFILLTIFKKQLDPPPPPTTVALTAPKFIPHQEIFKQPEPPPKPIPPPEPVPVPVVEQPKPKPKPEPVVEAPKPKKEKAPEPVKPKKVVKVKPEPAPAPAPSPHVAKDPAPRPAQVKANTPPATGVVTQPTAAPVVDQSAQVLKSLSFLSSNSKASSKGGVTYTNSAKKDFMASPTLGGGSKDSKVLDSLSSAAGDSSIKTKSSRSISSDVKFGGHGKSLNDVQGRVSASELASGKGGGLGLAGGVSVSGPGNLSEAEIEKALSKFLSKFQFCYEKSLISDSSLGGNLRLQWTIESNGSVSGAKVIQSQMNNSQLHSCILGVLKEVPFPSPKGGSVTAKKTLNFKSSTL